MIWPGVSFASATAAKISNKGAIRNFSWTHTNLNQHKNQQLWIWMLRGSAQFASAGPADHPRQQIGKPPLDVNQRFFPRRGNDDLLLLARYAAQNLARAFIHGHAVSDIGIHFGVPASVAAKRGQADIGPNVA